MSHSTPDQQTIYRILDANLNRLREALRVIEEFPRFGSGNTALSVKLKTARHALIDIESALGREKLLENRDTDSDPFSRDVRPEELVRAGVEDILVANLKRAQEAARVLEEYGKVSQGRQVPDKAKRIRFLLYSLEKDLRRNTRGT